MRMEDRYRWILALVIGTLCAAGTLVRLYREKRLKRGFLSDGVYTRQNAGMLPCCFLMGMLFAFFPVPGRGTGSYWEIFMPGMSALLLQLCLYDTAMLLLLPLLRRILHPSVTAFLWLIPNGLYIFAYGTQVSVPPFRPLWIIRIPASVLGRIGLVWLCGFVLVLAWRIAGHFAFRHEVLGCARDVDEKGILRIYDGERGRIGEGEHRLVRSPAVRTPLSIGMGRHGVIVLPEREYTPKQYRLILRHELIHLQRGDSDIKFFMSFCCALAWFFPPVWTAMRRCAEDIELSCDEAVLTGTGEGLKKHYAELILDTAGEERGFTTCLSAAAKSLKYRVGSILHPGSVKPAVLGALITGLFAFGIFFTCGYVCLAAGCGSAREVLFQEKTPEVLAASVTSVTDGNGSAWDGGSIGEERMEELLSGIGDLPLYRTGFNWNTTDNQRILVIAFQSPEGEKRLQIRDHLLLLETGAGKQERYFLYEPFDWEWADAVLALPSGAS